MSATPSARRFQDAVVIVTGSGQGIGRGVAHRFANEGARVIVLDRDRHTCHEVAREIIDAGGRASPLVADLADTDARSGVIGQVLEEAGRLDVLVHNAAYLGPRRPLAELTDADVREVVEVNLVAPLLLSREALPHLEQTRGAIVLISSIQAFLPLPTFVPYVATKGAIEAMTRAMAVEMAPRGVRINAVAPGAVESPAMRVQWEESTGRDGAPPAPTLVGRWGTDGDIADVVAFLASPEAAYICGETIRADGGRLLSRDADPLGNRR